MSKKITKSEKETRQVAAKFARKLKGGEVIELIGDLGSGKTTFVRGVAEALGSKARVKSPTFTIMNEYPVDHKKIRRIIHIDLYRFDNSSQLEALEMNDYKRKDSVTFIEWPDILDDTDFNATHKIEFEFVDESTRKIKMI